MRSAPQPSQRGRRPAVTDAEPAQRCRLRDRGARRAGGVRPDQRTTWPPRSWRRPPTPSVPAAARRPDRRGPGRGSAAEPADPARPARRRPHLWPRSAQPTGLSSWSSSCHWPAVTGRAPTYGWATWLPLLARHLPADDPLVGYPDLLAHPPLAEESLRGYLTGSIDAVLRVGPTEARRYLVVDYKTNWLGRGGPGELTVADYSPAAHGGRHDRRALPLAGAAVPGGAAPDAALAAAGLRPGAASRRGALPVPAGHGRAGDARAPTTCRTGCSAGDHLQG